MTLLKKSAISLALFACVQSVSANEWTVGLVVGQSSFDGINDVCFSIPAIGLNCGAVEDTDSSIGLNVNYAFNKNWALELGYIDLGEYTTEQTFGRSALSGITFRSGSNVITADASALYFSGVGTLPLSDAFSVSARLGVFSPSGEVTSSGFVSSRTGVDDDAAATFGVSLNYQFNEKFSAEVRYDDFDEIDLVALGFKYHF